MENKPEKSNKRTNQLINGLMILGLSLLSFLILVGVFGNAGEYVKNFFIGLFGYSIYGYSIALILVGILMIIGWSAQAKLGVKLAFGALIAFIIAMCHLGASQELFGLSYGEYLKQCYLTHSTAGGVLGGILFYPMTKAYIFSMVFLGLFVAGLVALLIVMHINYELIVPSKSNKVRVFNKKNKIKNNQTDFIVEPYEDNQLDFDGDNHHVLYNGTIDGKSLPDNFSKGKNSDGLDYVPMENIDSIEKEFDEEEPYKPVKGRKNNALREDLSPTQQEAIKVLYDNDSSQNLFTRPANRQVDVTNTLNQIKKNKKIEKKEEEKAKKIEKTEVKEEKSNKELDDKYKYYTNNYRKNQVLENMGVSDCESDSREKEDNFDSLSNEDFMKEIEDSINKNVSIEEKIEDINEDTIANNDVKENVIEEKYPKVDLHLDDLDKPRDNDKYKVDEDKLRSNRVKELGAQGHNDYVKDITAQSHVNIIDNQKTNVVPQEDEVEEVKVEEKKKRPIKPYTFPTVDCLKDYDSTGSFNEEAMKKKCETLETRMSDFGIDVKVENIVKGPAFSRIEFTTTSTINKVVSHANDIAMWLEAKSLRLEAPIPGRNCCGIEIPNDNRGTVGLKDIINSKEFKEADPNKGLYFALGKDIDGKTYVSNISELPHALIAGSTGSGKSVCINCLLLSMLYKYTPEQLRFILVDPKIVELNKYSNIPHLLIPEILSDPKKVVKTLRWLAVEMDRRYEVLMEEYVSNIQEYNSCVDKEKRLPSIVVIIDEVGDIMLSPVGKEFEQLVIKLAQKSRAAGIHLILATQRPSVDVITGLIKANLPARIAFAVANGVDSRTVLDTIGAEKLLRKGDMLFKHADKIVRIQGPYVDPSEIKAIVTQVKDNNEVIYDDEAYAAINQPDESEQAQEEVKEIKESVFPDELCPDVLRYGLIDKELSSSKLQRKFSIGFNRAAKITDWMKDQGYMEEVGNKKKFLLTEEQVEKIIYNAENGITEEE